MNIDKAKKRTAKQVKKEVNGYPHISLEYFGEMLDSVTEVIISFTVNKKAKPQDQTFLE